MSPDNMYLSESDVVKLGDFGLNRLFEHSNSKRQHHCSTYTAPEVLEGRSCLKSDVWSLGYSTTEMAQGRDTFLLYEGEKLKERILKNDPPSLSASHGWSNEFMDFVSRCLVRDVEKRASVAELLNVSVAEMR